MNKASFTRNIMAKWKTCTTLHLEQLVRDELRMTDSAFRQLLCRLRADRHIFTSYFPDYTLHFDRGSYRRWKFLEELPDTEREKFVSKSGIEHNLEMLGLSIQLKRLWPEFDVIPNVLAEKAVNTFGNHDRREKHIPDLVLRSSSYDSSFIYVEVERSLKERGRYVRKWTAYEGDFSVGACLYWISDKRILSRLVSDAAEFFSRGLGFEDFRIGFISSEDFAQRSNHVEVEVVSAAGRSAQRLDSVFAQSKAVRRSELQLQRGAN